MAALQFVQIPIHSDNYAVLMHDPDRGQTGLIDAPEMGPIAKELSERGWNLDQIYITHKHNDHIAGVPGLKKKFGCVVTGPEKSARLTGIYDRTVREGDRIDFAGHPIEVLETPGHTADHVTYYLPQDKTAFVGDTLFSLGCGRLFEGDAKTMWGSLNKIRALPDETVIYCGHEYTQSNADFAVTIDPANEALMARRDAVYDLRNSHQPTLPTDLAQEKATNPFLRADNELLKSAMNMSGQPDAVVFAAIRQAKDNF